jgi:hypothetical protein
VSQPAYYVTPPAPPQFTLPAGTTWGRVVVPPPEQVPWYVYREAFARMARAAFAEAGLPVIVRSGWHLRLKIGETLTLLKNGPVAAPRTGEGTGKIFGLMLNFERAQQPAPEGQTIGTHDLPVILGVTAWLMRGYERRTAAEGGQAEVERACRQLMWAVRLNTKWGLLGAASELMQDVQPLQFPAVDLHGFSDGTEVFIAQGATALTVVEQDTREVPQQP